jgi:chromate reductase
VLTLLLVSGSTRAASTNTAALRTMTELTPAGVVATLYEGLGDLPAFNPDDQDTTHPAVQRLRRELAQADAVVFCTPEYAGSLPGSFKNLLDWTVGSGELYGKPVAQVNVAAEPRGRGAEAALTSVLGYVGAALIEQAVARLPVARQAVGSDGTVADEQVRAGLAGVVQAVVDHLLASGRQREPKSAGGASEPRP